MGKCGHGLTSRPRESASELFLDELLGLCRCPPGSGRALLAGTLPLRKSAARFACKTPTWRLPVPGHVVDLVTAGVVLCGRLLLHWVSGSGPGRKRIRLNRKNHAHLTGFAVQSPPRVWKRLHHVVLSSVSLPDHKRRRDDQDDGGYNLAQVRTGVG